MAESGLDYRAERTKAKVEKLKAKGRVNKKRLVIKKAKPTLKVVAKAAKAAKKNKVAK